MYQCGKIIETALEMPVAESICVCKYVCVPKVHAKKTDLISVESLAYSHRTEVQICPLD